MAKQLNQINVNLAFSADTKNVQKQIQKLVAELDSISKGTATIQNLPLTKEIQEAQIAAKQLSKSLQEAFNTSTGTLDLANFNSTLQKSNMSLSQYADKLTMLGKEGDQAFLKIAQAIINTQTPLIKSNALLTEFFTTLQNTARWQISSSILHGFMGAVQSAYGYAEDLNESLNNIRIVTAANVDEMSKFAAEANKAAKSLSTTTTNYTNASLIYYQQGLTDEEVKKRTDITVKMANVAKQSAETVSDQLTAIWNNFYEQGGQSLEHYADAMTKLGAETASSTDEIAGGLEKFASIGSLIGLSFDNAAAALATITAVTRQSEDVVGTALKTIFARIQGLNLGETLDDGTTLNKYSEALDKVGISIFEQNGELKTMDDILNEIGQKWKELAKDEQVALAQTVTGVRQYNQLVSLMDNFDIYQSNLDSAKNSTGALSQQQKIYEESWEASAKRVQTSMETIYSQLLDENFFIEINNGLEKALKSLSNFIDALGGIKGVLSTVGLIITSIFKDEIGTSINTALSNFKAFSGIAKKEMAQMQKEAYDLAQSMTKDLVDNEGIEALRTSLMNTYTLQTDLRKNMKNMTTDQKEVAQAAIQVAEEYNQIALEAGKAAQSTREMNESHQQENRNKFGSGLQSSLEDAMDSANMSGGSRLIGFSEQALRLAREISTSSDEIYSAYSQAQEALRDYQTVLSATDATQDEINEASNHLINTLNNLSQATQHSTDVFDKYQSKINDSARKVVSVQSSFNTLKQSLDVKGFNKAGLADKIKQLAQEATNVKMPLTDLNRAIQVYDQAMVEAGDDADKQALALKNLEDVFRITSISIEQIDQAIEDNAKTGLRNQDALQGMERAMRSSAESARQAAEKEISFANATNEANNKMHEAKAIINGSGLAYKSLGSAIAGTLQGISSFATGLNSLSSIKDTITDNDLSNFEKMTSIMTSLSMTIPMLTTGLKSIGDMFRFVTSTTTEGMSAQLGYLLGLTNEQMKTQELCITKTGEILIREQVGDAAFEEALKKEGSVKATQVETAAIWKNIAAKIVQNLHILAIVAALAVLAAAIYFAVKAYNAEAEAAKKAAQTAEDLAEANNKVKESYEGLKDGFDAYDEAISALDQCIEGTEEWNEALKKVNETALDLLNTYPELLKQKDLFTRNENGMLAINENVKESVLKQAENQTNTSQAAALMGSVMAAEAANRSQATDLGRSAGSTGIGRAYYAQGKVYYDDVINVGKILVANAAKLAELDEEEYRAEVKKLLDEAASDYAKSYSNYDSQINSLVDKCVTYQSVVDSLVENTKAAANQMANVALLIAEQALGDKYDDTAKVMASREYVKISEQIYNDIIELDKNNDKSDTQTEQSIEIWRRFNKANGTNLVASVNQIQGSNDNRVYAYKGEDGEKTYTIEYIAQTIAAHEALEQLTGSADKATASLSTLQDKVGEDVASGIQELITNGSMSTMTQQDRYNMQNAIDTDDNNSLSQDEVITYLKDSLGMTEDELVTIFGVETINEVYEQWADAWRNGRQALADAGNNLSKTTKAMYDDLVATKEMNFLDVFDRETFAEYLNTAFIVSGREGAQALSDAFKKTTEKEQAAFIDALEKVDWKTVDILELRKTLYDCGVAVQYTDEELQALIDSMQTASEITLENATENYSTIKEILDGLNIGDTISAKDFAFLSEEYQKYFTLMADGSYQLIADAKTFYNLVKNNSIESFNEIQSEAAVANEKLNNILNHKQFGLYDDTNRAYGLNTAWGGGSNFTNTKRNMQLDLIEQMNLTDAGQLQEWKIGLAENSLSKDDIQAIADTINNWMVSVGGAEKAYELLNDTVASNELIIRNCDSAIASTAESISELINLINNGEISVEAYNQQLNTLVSSSFENTESLSELSDALSIVEQTGAEIDYGIYSKNLIRLAESYENCSTEIYNYQKALLDGDQASIEAAEEALEAAVMVGEASEKYGLVSKEVEIQAKQMSNAYKISLKEAVKIATQNQRMNRGIITLAENWETWNAVLLDSDTTTTDWAKSASEASAAIADLVGASADLQLPAEFFNPTNMLLLENAINGDINAINALGLAVATQQVQILEFNAGLAEMTMATWELSQENEFKILNEEQFENDKQFIINELDSLKKQVGTAEQEMSADWVAALNRMALATGMSVDEMNGLLGSMGVQAKVTTTYIPQRMEVPTYTEHTEAGQTDPGEKDPDTGLWIRPPSYTRKTYTVPGAPYVVEGHVPVAQISTEDNPLTLDIDTENTKVSPSSSGSTATYYSNRGSISQSTKDAVQAAQEKTKEDEPDPAEVKEITVKREDYVIERYKEITDDLDDLEDALNDASKAADDLWGQSRIDALKKTNNLIEAEIKKLQQYKAAIEKDLVGDRDAVINAANDLGITSLRINGSDGHIEGYDTAMLELYDQMYALQIYWANPENFATAEEQDAYEKNIEDLQNKIDNFQSLIEQYDTTRELLEDTVNEIDDDFREWQNNNMEMLEHQLEVNIHVNENDMKRIELALSRFEDNFFKMAETAALLANDSVNNAKANLKDYEDYYNVLNQMYADGQIDEDAYNQGINTTRDGIYDQLEALIALDKQMKDYYGNTVDAAKEEVDSFTDHMEHLSGVFDHYLNLMDILGKQKDYDAMRNFMEGQVQVTRDRLEVAKAEYEMYKAQKEYFGVQLADLDPNDENYDYIKKQWEVATDALDEAQDEMLSLTEEWATQMKEVVKLNMDEIAETLEKSLTNGLGFEVMIDQYDKLNERQEEYLTKTNQIYETNKLMRTANKALDEADNKVVKQKLKNFITETKGLQEKTQLSEYELEIQQAKYDLLLAEIALEEAQNAKSTVRLTRDNEGNFGYVYTADEQQVADAEQKYEDEQNKLYNISLQGQQEYTQKYLQAQQEMYNELTALQEAYLNGEIATEEEYKARQAAIIEHYYGEGGVLQTYAELYNIAAGKYAEDGSAWQIAAADATADNWQKDYSAMTQNTDDWADAVGDYLEDIDEETEKWAEISGQANKDVKGALEDSAKATEDLTDESKELRNYITSKLIPAIDKETREVIDQTKAFLKQRDQIKDLINWYEKLIAKLDAYQAKQAKEIVIPEDTAKEEIIDSTPEPEQEDTIEVENDTEVSTNTAVHSDSDHRNVAKAIWLDKNSGWGNAPGRPELLREKGFDPKKVQSYLQPGGPAYNGTFVEEWYADGQPDLKQWGYSVFETGGYTGTWGPEGKMAVLHEKELVLNADDTENILKTVSFIREVMGMIDSRAAMSGFSGILSTPGIHNNESTFEQNVTIHAEFTGPMDRYEIEEAFNNLVNRATQYANRK